MEHREGSGGSAAGGIDCGRATGWLVAYADGGLDDARDAALREHLVACPACRAAATALDPSLLFLELRAAPLPRPFWTGFRTRLRAALLRTPPSRWRWPGLPRPALMAAPLAMLLVLVGSLFILRPSRQRFIPASRALRPPQEAPARPAALAAQSAPALEEAGSPRARVYRFTVGGPDDETPIYLVVDEAIDF